MRLEKKIPEGIRGFDSIILLVYWELWMERNRRTFQAVALSPSLLLLRIVDEANAWLGGGVRCYADLLGAW